MQDFLFSPEKPGFLGQDIYWLEKYNVANQPRVFLRRMDQFC